MGLCQLRRIGPAKLGSVFLHGVGWFAAVLQKRDTFRLHAQKVAGAATWRRYLLPSGLFWVPVLFFNVVVMAHLTITALALKLSPDGTTLFGMAVGIRRTVEPPLREGYYGNAFVKANLAMKAGELSNSALSHVVKLIKEAKKAALEKRYVSEQLKETEESLEMKAMCQGGNGAFMLLTDWRQLGLLDEVDFGYGGSVNIIPLVPKFLSDICVFLPRKQGGVRVLVTLPKPAMDSLKEYMNPLSI